MMPIQTVAVGAAMLIGGVAVFQLALALGLPLGEATLGGRAFTVDGALTGGFRLVAAASAVVLIAVAWLILARAGVTGSGPLSEVFVGRATWTIFGFLILNTLANFAAPHPVERWAIGSITLVIVGFVGLVAART